MAPNIQTYTLANGLRVIHTPSPTQVVYCGFAIKAGTRHEAPHQQGIAHLVEHMIFKGTTHRKAWHILNRMENVGGDLNAFTNKEEMLVYAAFMREHTERAIELLTDIVFHSTYPQHEMDKEVEVVVDEILSYEDSPSELIFDNFEEMIFPNHPLGRNILGTPDKLRTYRTNDAQAFTMQHYKPNNMVMFLKGDVDFCRIVRWAEKYIGRIQPNSSSNNFESSITPPLAYQPQTLTLHKETHQAHVVMGGRAYDANDRKRTVLYLLCNILGGPGMNSRLNLALRERRGLVYNVECNMIGYTDTGLWNIYFGCDHKDMHRCRELVLRELTQLREKRLTDSQLAAAKKQIIGQIGVAADNFENRALDMGKSFLHYNKFEDSSVLFNRIYTITADELQEVANEMFAPSYISTLIYQ